MGLSKQIKGQLHQYFRMKIGAFDYRRGWMKSRCPYCNTDLKFGINITQNRCNCFKCGEHPNPIELVKYLEGVQEYRDVIKILSDKQYEGFHFKEEKVELKEHKPIYLPEGFKSILLGKSQLARTVRSYVQGRGFNLMDVAERGWGYCNTGKYFGYLILPFIENGKVVYFNARNVIGNGPKYNNPEATENGVGKSMVIYNRDALYMYDKVYLCEGLLNATTMGVRGVSFSGKALSRWQKTEIIKSPVKDVVILLDPDAKDRAIELALELSPFKRVKVIFLPEGKDCNDLGKQAVMRLVREIPYQDYRQLLQLKNQYIK